MLATDRVSAVSRAVLSTAACRSARDSVHHYNQQSPRHNERSVMRSVMSTTICVVMLAFVTIIVLLSLAAIIAPSAEASAIVDVTTYSVRNPKISVNYTDPVFIVEKSLIALDIDNPTPEYPLCQLPAQEGQQSFTKTYTLYTKQDADSRTCQGGESAVLIPGRYQLTLEAVDPQGKPTMPNSIDILEFIIDGIDIMLSTPASGVANLRPFNIYFVTSENAVCRYSFTSKPFEQMTATTEGAAYSQNHNIPSVDYIGDLYIICEEQSGRQTPAKFDIGWDLTAPVITVNASPARLIDPRYKYVSITATTDENTTCWIDGELFPRDDPRFPVEDPARYSLYTKKHDLVRYYNEITDNQEHNFTYDIKCRNLAGRESTKQLNVTVDFGEFVFIDVLSPLPVIRESSFELRVRPTFPADTCKVNGAAMEVDGDDTSVFTTFLSGIEGRNRLFLNCSGAKNATREYNMTIDTTPPDTPTLNASDAVCANVISARFNATDPGGVGATGILSYTYAVSDARGVIVSDTQLSQQVSVMLSRAILPPLRWEVYATDYAGNNGTSAIQEIAAPIEGEDEECGLPAFITIQAPNSGFSQTKPYSLVLGTLRASECRYTLQPGAPWSAMTLFTPSEDKRTHTKAALTFTDTLLYVGCNETAGDTAGLYHRKTVHVGIDASAPRIAVLTAPNPVVDTMAKIVLVSVTTDDDTYCTHNSTDGPQFTTLADTAQAAYVTEHTSLFDYRALTSTTRERRTAKVTCKNLAHEQNSSVFMIVIDLGAPLRIETLSPDQYVAESDVLLKVKPSKIASCTWQNSGGGGDDGDAPTAFTSVDEENNTHEVTLSGLAEGSHSYVVECTAADGTGTTIVQFIVDKTPPVVTDLSGPATICPAQPASYRYNITGLDKNPVISYALERADGTGASFEDNTTDDVITLSVTGVDPGDYTLTVTPISQAGVLGTPATLGVAVMGRTDEACLQSSNHCTNGAQDPGEEGVDCGGTCSNECVMCSVANDCPAGLDCVEGFCGHDDACEFDEDCDLGEGCVLGECKITVCTANIHCNPGTICVEGSCVVPSSCIVDDDCGIGAGDSVVCSEGRCVVPSCGNRIKDVGETGIDCGGLCQACVACAADSDCPTPRVCASGVCASPSSCSLDADCDPQRVCMEGTCIPVAVCERDDDCAEGRVCTLHICAVPGVDGCVSDYDCAQGESCDAVTGECTVLEGGCTTDYDCQAGEVCNAYSGRCTVVDQGPDGPLDPDFPDNPIDEPEKSHLLSILLIVVGIAIMGGAGYFLYEQNHEKRAIAMQQALAAQAAQMSAQNARGRAGSAVGPSPIGGAGGPAGARPMDPQVIAKMRAEQAARLQAMRDEAAKRAAEKAAKRSSVFGGFDALVDGAPSGAGKENAPDAKDAADGTVAVGKAAGGEAKSAAEQDDPDDGFVDIGALGKKTSSQQLSKDADNDTARGSGDKTPTRTTTSESEDKKPDKKKSPGKTEDEDAFNELDKL